jgi:hypothetical protein
MQTVFTILTSIVVGLIARNRGLRFIGWAAIGLVTFLVVDTVVALIMLSAFGGSLDSDSAVMIVFFMEKAVVFGVIVMTLNNIIKAKSKESQSKEVLSNTDSEREDSDKESINASKPIPRPNLLLSNTKSDSGFVVTQDHQLAVPVRSATILFLQFSLFIALLAMLAFAFIATSQQISFLDLNEPLFWGFHTSASLTLVTAIILMNLSDKTYTIHKTAFIWATLIIGWIVILMMAYLLGSTMNAFSFINATIVWIVSILAGCGIINWLFNRVTSNWQILGEYNMPKNCNTCGKQLTFRDSFVWEGKPICKMCLKKAEDEIQKTAIVQQRATESKILIEGSNESKLVTEGSNKGEFIWHPLGVFLYVVIIVGAGVIGYVLSGGGTSDPDISDAVLMSMIAFLGILLGTIGSIYGFFKIAFGCTIVGGVIFAISHGMSFSSIAIAIVAVGSVHFSNNIAPIMWKKTT